MLQALESETVARKKGTDRKTLGVRIRAQLVKKAQAVAQDRGIDLSDYLSDVVEATVERDWSRIVRRLANEGDS